MNEETRSAFDDTTLACGGLRLLHSCETPQTDWPSLRERTSLPLSALPARKPPKRGCYQVVWSARLDDRRPALPTHL